MENIDLLKKNEIDLAIIQRNVLLNSFYDEENGVKNLSVVLPLFEEKLNAYTNFSKHMPTNKLDSLSKHKDLIIGFTGENSFSYQIF